MFKVSSIPEFLYVFHDHFYKEIINFETELPLLCQCVKINPFLNQN